VGVEDGSQVCFLHLLLHLHRRGRRYWCPDEPARAIAGAVAILAAFADAQARVVDIRSWRYLWLNFLGALALALAGYDHQWGFLMLNSVRSAVSAVALVALARRSLQSD